MAETFYRIKGADGYLYMGADDVEWGDACHASSWGVRPDGVLEFARQHYDPTARVVKTTLRRSRHADAWCGNLRFDDHGDSKAHVSQPQRGHWIYSICQQADYWEDSSVGYATEDEAKAAADAYLRKRGWVLA